MPRHDYPDQQPQSGKHRQKPRCVQDGNAGDRRCRDRRCRDRRCRDRRCRDRRCRDRRCRDRRCRDVPAGASDMSTGRRMLLQRTDATAPPQADPLHTVFYKRLCAVPAYVHFEKQRTHLIGTSLHLLADRQPKSRIRKTQAETAAMRIGRRCRDRRCRDVPAGASDMSTNRRMHLQRTDATEPPRTDPLHTVFYQHLCAAPASVHFEKQRTHLVGTSLHPPAGRQPESRIWRKRKKENTANVSLYVFNIF